jgi:hypothetical protein
MSNVKTKKSTTTTAIKPSVVAQTLSFVPNKARSDENVSRAKAVSGMSYEDALAHYGTLYPKGAKTHLNYDINKIGSLKLA